jgi:hypothetical protein
MKRFLLWGVAIVIVLGIIGAIAGGGGSSKNAGSSGSSNPAPSSTASPASTSPSSSTTTPPTSSAPQETESEKQAVTSAKSYLGLGTGFSRHGLIQQLTSKAGSGFPHKDAVYAINALHINWNKEAVLAAKSYLKLGTGFSRSGLIQQLQSKSGSGFTHAQAVYAANKVGL